MERADSSVSIAETKGYSEVERWVEAACMLGRIDRSAGVYGVQRRWMDGRPSGSLAKHGPITSVSVKDLEHKSDVPIKGKHNR